MEWPGSVRVGTLVRNRLVCCLLGFPCEDVQCRVRVLEAVAVTFRNESVSTRNTTPIGKPFSNFADDIVAASKHKHRLVCIDGAFQPQLRAISQGVFPHILMSV